MAEIKDQIPTLESDKGRIYFYRENSLLSEKLPPFIYLNNQAIGTSIPGSFFFVDCPPGLYEVKAINRVTIMSRLPHQITGQTHLNIFPGKKYYVNTSASYELIGNKVTPSLIDEAEAMPQLAKLRYTGPLNFLQPNTVRASARPALSDVPPSTIASKTISSPVPSKLPTATQQDSTSFMALKQGTWSYHTEKFAVAQGCNSKNSGAWVVGKEEFGDIYQVNCADGNALLVACDRAQCSVK
ncbi:hypothetical protein CSQ89_01705 [Chitinimonas sp. BJB300]|nr:hypothetical protein CSQ89_01705 [Chitinimonas sp. BJB300]